MKFQLAVLALAAFICAVSAEHLKASSDVKFSSKQAIDHKTDSPVRKPFGRAHLKRRIQAVAPVPDADPDEPVPELTPEVEEKLSPAPVDQWVHESTNEEVENRDEEHIKKGDKNHNSSLQNDRFLKKKNEKLFEAYNKDDEDVQQTPDNYRKKTSKVNYVKDFSKKKTKLETKHRTSKNDHESYLDHAKNLFASSKTNQRRKGLGNNEVINSNLISSQEEAFEEREG